MIGSPDDIRLSPEDLVKIIQAARDEERRRMLNKLWLSGSVGDPNLAEYLREFQRRLEYER